MIVLHSLTSLVLASAIAWLELVTSKYPRTVSLVAKSLSLWIYALAYGGIAFIGMLVVGLTGASDSLRIQGLGEHSPWIQSLAIGLSAKALLHLRFFTVTIAGQQFPVGTESLVQIFEPWLLRSILLDEYNAVCELIGPRARKYSDLAAVKKTIKRNIPRSLPKDETEAFEADVDQSKNVEAAMELYLRSFGRKTFDRVFQP